VATLLQSVLRQLAATAVEVGEDAALLRRFVEKQDHPAFGVLVQRHGGLVWGVCRRMLPSEADAEDAFQATFLALVRSAGPAMAATSFGGWLHGVAVRVCLKARRTAARRRKREERAAKGDAVLIGELAWDELHAAVHEEVAKLPAAHRTAFVLCDLQGVRQHDAAARLGWKVGTLTGRLARARQQLMKRLTARGLAPSVSLAVTAGFAPAALADKALTLAVGGEAIPATVLTLTQSVLEGVAMKVKVMAAVLLTATAMSVGVGGWLATADAQPGPGGYPGAGGGGSAVGPGPGMSAAPKPRVEHALVDLPKSEKQLADLFNKRQAEGWEFAGQVELSGKFQKLAFKRPVAKSTGTGIGMPGGMPGAGGEGGFGEGGGARQAPEDQYAVLRLKHAKAADVSAALTKLFSTDTRIVAEQTSNSIIIVGASEKVMTVLKKIVDEIDQPEKPTK